MSFFYAGSGASISLVARRASELVRIMDLQQSRLGMTHKSLCVLIRSLAALGRHHRRADLQRLARAHVARFTPVDDVGIGDIDLLDLRVPLGGFLFQSLDLGWREVNHVISDVLRHPGVGFVDRLQNLTQFSAYLGTLVTSFV